MCKVGKSKAQIWALHGISKVNQFEFSSMSTFVINFGTFVECSSRVRLEDCQLFLETQVTSFCTACVWGCLFYNAPGYLGRMAQSFSLHTALYSSAAFLLRTSLKVCLWLLYRVRPTSLEGGSATPDVDFLTVFGIKRGFVNNSASQAVALQKAVAILDCRVARVFVAATFISWS